MLGTLQSSVRVPLFERGEEVHFRSFVLTCVLYCTCQVAELVKELRCELDQLLQDKIKNPSMDLCMCPRGSRIIGMIVELVTTQ